MEPQKLPKVRGQNKIRVAPRRSSVQPNAWGINSVPRMLTDFQRHSSIVAPEELDERDWLLHYFGLVAIVLMYAAVSVAFNYHTSVFCALLISGWLCLLVCQVRPPATANFRIPVFVLALYFLKIEFVPIVTGLSVLNYPKEWFSVRKFQWQSLWLGVVIIVLGFINLSGGVIAGMAILCNSDINLSYTKFIGSSLGFGAVVFACIRSVPPLHLLALLALITAAALVYIHAEPQVNKYEPIICFTGSALLYTSCFKVVNYYVIPSIALLVPNMLTPVRNPIPTRGTPKSLTILESILVHKDTRHIFYFFLLNFGFMFVQLLYSLLTHSLVLMSDSIHMFFDCLALLVGLVASILAKMPPSDRFPFGVGLVETVSGFANGCLLLAISVGILFESFERVFNPVQLERVTELMVVSTLGLMVNLVGIFVFHHGHNHSHGHGHEHEHEHESVLDKGLGIHDHSHSHNHDHDHDHDHDHENDSNDPHSHDNIQGIFLHILADTLGSVGAIAATLLTKYTGWPGFDALMSMVISALIFASALPLVKSSARSLLLGLNDHDEYQMRDVLNEIYTIPNVISYKQPKFWNDGKQIRGVIHVQYKEQPEIIRTKIKQVFASHKIGDVFVQMEHEEMDCWCRNPQLLP